VRGAQTGWSDGRKKVKGDGAAASAWRFGGWVTTSAMECREPVGVEEGEEAVGEEVGDEEEEAPGGLVAPAAVEAKLYPE
jgi:hypothetical protein